jgi:hypothetical protein
MYEKISKLGDAPFQKDIGVKIAKIATIIPTAINTTCRAKK